MGIERYLEDLGVRVPGGSGWRPVKCPYHTDRTASASVNLTTDRFHCFCCGISEDLIGLIRRDTGVSYVEAEQAAENEYGASPTKVRGRHEPTMPLLPRREGNQPRNSTEVRPRGGSGWRERL